MSSQFIAALWITFVLCTMVCLVTEKAYIGTGQDDTTQSVLDMVNMPLYISSSSATDIAFPALVTGFFTGIWRILVWDYSFFKLNPALQIVRMVFCYPITIAAVWGLLQMFAGAIQSLFAR